MKSILRGASPVANGAGLIFAGASLAVAQETPPPHKLPEKTNDQASPRSPPP